MVEGLLFRVVSTRTTSDGLAVLAKLCVAPQRSESRTTQREIRIMSVLVPRGCAPELGCKEHGRCVQPLIPRSELGSQCTTVDLRGGAWRSSTADITAARRSCHRTAPCSAVFASLQRATAERRCVNGRDYARTRKT